MKWIVLYLVLALGISGTIASMNQPSEQELSPMEMLFSVLEMYERWELLKRKDEELAEIIKQHLELALKALIRAKVAKIYNVPLEYRDSGNCMEDEVACPLPGSPTESGPEAQACARVEEMTTVTFTGAVDFLEERLKYPSCKDFKCKGNRLVWDYE